MRRAASMLAFMGTLDCATVVPERDLSKDPWLEQNEDAHEDAETAPLSAKMSRMAMGVIDSCVEMVNDGIIGGEDKISPGSLVTVSDSKRCIVTVRPDGELTWQLFERANGKNALTVVETGYVPIVYSTPLDGTPERKIYGLDLDWPCAVKQRNTDKDGVLDEDVETVSCGRAQRFAATLKRAYYWLRTLFEQRIGI